MGVVEVGPTYQVPSSGEVRINGQRLLEIGARLSHVLLRHAIAAEEVPPDRVEVIGLQAGWGFPPSQFGVGAIEPADQRTSDMLYDVIAQAKEVGQGSFISL